MGGLVKCVKCGGKNPDKKYKDCLPCYNKALEEYWGIGYGYGESTYQEGDWILYVPLLLLIVWLVIKAVN